MGIEKVELYVCTCDNCGHNYEYADLYMVYPDEQEADNACRNDGDWIKYSEKYYCDDCYEIDADDNIRILESKNNNK